MTFLCLYGGYAVATTATPTTIRVLCHNTLTIAQNGTTSAIRVPHSTAFDAQAVKKQLGIASPTGTASHTV